MVSPSSSLLVYHSHPFQPIGPLHTTYVFFVYRYVDQLKKSARRSNRAKQRHDPRRTGSPGSSSPSAKRADSRLISVCLPVSAFIKAFIYSNSPPPRPGRGAGFPGRGNRGTRLPTTCKVRRGRCRGRRARATLVTAPP